MTEDAPEDGYETPPTPNNPDRGSGSDPSVSEDDVREAANEIDAEANNHHTDYAAGMRLARQIMESELLDSE